MARYGLVEDNTITNIIEADQTFIDTLEGTWVLLEDRDGIGHDYDPDTGTCYPKKPFPSWIKDEAIHGWVSPVAMPDDIGWGEGKRQYTWDEDNLQWLPVEET